MTMSARLWRSTSKCDGASMSCSNLLAADAPAALAQFHGALLGVELQPGLSITLRSLAQSAAALWKTQPRLDS